MKKKKKSLKERAKTDSGRMKILMAMEYKDGMIYIRQIDEELFIWDAVYKNKLYSSYLVIKLSKNKKKLPSDVVDEVRDMCYAGAASTIDMQMGVKISDKTMQMVKDFENTRKQVEVIN